MSRNAFPQLEREYNEALNEREERAAERATHHGVNLMQQPPYVPEKIEIVRPGAQDALKIKSKGGTETTYHDRAHP
jgi:hypothetical protein